MKITSPDSPQVDDLLVTADDVKVAIFMSKVLTKALTTLTHKHLKAKLTNQFSSFVNQQLSADMSSQISKIAAAETALTNKEKSPSVPPSSTPAAPLAPAATTKPATIDEPPKKTNKGHSLIIAPEEEHYKVIYLNSLEIVVYCF